MAGRAARGGPLCVGVLIFVKFISLRCSVTMLGRSTNASVLHAASSAAARSFDSCLARAAREWPVVLLSAARQHAGTPAQSAARKKRLQGRLPAEQTNNQQKLPLTRSKQALSV